MISGFFLTFDALPYFAFCLAIAIGATVIILKGQERLSWPIFMPIITGLSGISLWSIWAMYMLKSLNCLILIKRKHEEQGFIARNRDQLIVALFSAVVGAAIGALLTSWLTFMAHSPSQSDIDSAHAAFGIAGTGSDAYRNRR